MIKKKLQSRDYQFNPRSRNAWIHVNGHRFAEHIQIPPRIVREISRVVSRTPLEILRSI